MVEKLAEIRLRRFHEVRRRGAVSPKLQRALAADDCAIEAVPARARDTQDALPGADEARRARPAPARECFRQSSLQTPGWRGFDAVD